MGPQAKRGNPAGMIRLLVKKVDNWLGELIIFKNSANLRTKTLALGTPTRRERIKLVDPAHLYAMFLEWIVLQDPILEVGDFPTSVTDQITTDIEHEKALSFVVCVSKARQCVVV